MNSFYLDLYTLDQTCYLLNLPRDVINEFINETRIHYTTVAGVKLVPQFEIDRFKSMSFNNKWVPRPYIGNKPPSASE